MQRIYRHVDELKIHRRASHSLVAGEKEHISLTSEKVKWVLPPNAVTTEPWRAARSERSPGVKRGRGRPRHHHPDDLQVRSSRPAPRFKRPSFLCMQPPALQWISPSASSPSPRAFSPRMPQQGSVNHVAALQMLCMSSADCHCARITVDIHSKALAYSPAVINFAT